MKRDPMAQEQISAARGSIMPDGVCEEPGCVRLVGHPEMCQREDGSVILVSRSQVPADGFGNAMREIDSQIEAVLDQQRSIAPPMMPQVLLRGDDHAVFATFADICAKLEAHQRAGADLMREYQDQLAKVSAMAARHAR